MSTRPLPEPDSDALHAVVRTSELRRIYRLLFERRDDPPTMVEIEQFLEAETGKSHSQRGRRVRQLYPIFTIEKTNDPRPKYRLIGWSDGAATANTGQVSGRIRAQVLSAGRCAFCGKTPLDDGVKLVVDHKLPREWGGSNELHNLQPLCDECNGGKQAWFASLGGDPELIRRAASFDEPHKRIGELLKAYEGQYIPDELIGAVASRFQYQQDWQKRARELRVLGWDIRWRKRKQGGRMVVSYGSFHSEPWPDGNVAAEIRRRGPAWLDRPGDGTTS